MKYTGLYFGSFNPIHIGHLIVAQTMMNTGLFSKIIFVVSPLNPFKSSAELIDQTVRLEMVKNAIGNNPDFEASDAEFLLPIPSYTIQTLNHFLEIYPTSKFAIIMGSDNIKKLHEWRDIEAISGMCKFFVYKRRGAETITPKINVEIEIVDAPYVDISATHIRELISKGKSLKYLVPEEVISILKTV